MTKQDHKVIAMPFGRVILSGLVAVSMGVAAQEKPSDQDDQPLHVAYANPNGDETRGVADYFAGFEAPDYSLGDVSGQQGWFGQSGNWLIADARPDAGAQHLEGLSTGLADSFAVGPDIAIASEPVNSAQARLRLGPAPGATWDFIPQDPGAALVITRVRFNPDRTIDAVESDGMGSFTIVPTGSTAPIDEYFTIGVEADRGTNEFEIFLNGSSIFTGLGFAPNIQNLAVASFMESGTAGDTFDMDDAEIFNGPLPGAGPDIPEFTSVPTLGTWGLITMSFMVVLVAGFTLRTRITV